MGEFCPLEELLHDEEWIPQLLNSGNARTAKAAQPTLNHKKFEMQCCKALATSRLISLLDEPWNYTISRLLLHTSPDDLVALGRLYGLAMPHGSLECSHWTVRATRAVYEPALLREVQSLLGSFADPNGHGAGKGLTPLMRCAMEGQETIVTALLRACAHVGLMDCAGRTALHYAVINSEIHVAGLLTQNGAGSDTEDTLGYSANKIAALHGLTLQDRSLELLRGSGAGRRHQVAFDCKDEQELVACGMQHADGNERRNISEIAAPSRSSTESSEVMREEEAAHGRRVMGSAGQSQKRRRIRCDVSCPQPCFADDGVKLRCMQACCSSVQSSLFACHFVALRRPLLIKGMACSSSAADSSAKPWTRERLVESCGRSQVEVASIPYSDDFGGREEPILTTIERFLELEINLFSPSGVPYYLFTAVDDVFQPLLARTIRSELGGLPERLPMPFEQFKATSMQFGIGGKGSGAPVHFHSHAFNILLTGQKQWWLWPPASAAMSRVHPAMLSHTLDKCEDWDACLEVVQEPGDVLYVPDSWGHAVLNMAEHSVCVAVEFED